MSPPKNKESIYENSWILHYENVEELVDAEFKYSRALDTLILLSWSVPYSIILSIHQIHKTNWNSEGISRSNQEKK